MDQTQQDIYMRELAVRVVVDDIESENTLLRKTSETGGRQYEGVGLVANLKWTGDNLDTVQGIQTTSYPQFLRIGIGCAAHASIGALFHSATWFTDARFGSTLAVYIAHYWPSVCFNMYSTDAAEKYGVASAANYAGRLRLKCDDGTWEFHNSSATGNADAACSLDVTALSITRAGAGTFLAGLTANSGGGDSDSQLSGDTLTHMVFLKANASTENIALLAAAEPNWQTMDRGLFIGDSSTAPTAAPAGGVFVYGVSGDTHLYGPANKTLVLDQSVYKDINIGGMLLSKPASSAPGTDTFREGDGGDTGIETYAFAVGEYVSGAFEVQHDYKEGTNLIFHVHWQGITAPTGTDKVKWQAIVTIARDETTPPNVLTLVGETDFDTQYECKRTDLTTIDGSNSGPGGTALAIGDQFLVKLSRVAASSDEYAGDALILTAGIHYQIDTIGSRQITIK